MGVSTAHHEETRQLTDGLSSVASRYSGRLHGAQQEEGLGNPDQLLLLSLHEVQRLFAVFQDEIQRVYPVLHSPDLFTSRIPSLYEHVRSPGLGPYRGTEEQKDVQLLKVVLAAALVLEDPGKAKLSQELVCSVEDEVGKIAAHPHIDLTEIRIMTVMVRSQISVILYTRILIWRARPSTIFYATRSSMPGERLVSQGG